MLAGVMQAGLLGKEASREALFKAGRQQIMSDAVETGEFRNGAAALLELGDAEGAKVLFDRFDTGVAQQLDDAKNRLDQLRYELDERDTLDDNARLDRSLKLQEAGFLLRVRQQEHKETTDEARTAIQDRNSRTKVGKDANGNPILIDTVSSASRPVGTGGSGSNAGDAELLKLLGVGTEGP